MVGWLHSRSASSNLLTSWMGWVKPPALKVGPTGYLPTCSHNCWSERRYLQVVSTAPFGNMPRKFLFPWHPDSIKQDSQMSPQASIYSGIPWRITAVVKQKQSMFNMAQHDSCISIGPVYTHSFIHSPLRAHPHPPHSPAISFLPLTSFLPLHSPVTRRFTPYISFLPTPCFPLP